ncbi:BatD family protein [Thioalkalicoccus limnaeus]|uniref:BatD family protein n=1 Tax=Thioalkalicoccus limnaeus TaxID=120681 RepID=A0ABV4BEU7_9GAMM
MTTADGLFGANSGLRRAARASLIVVAGWAAAAAADVDVWLSATTTPRDRPVELILEIKGELAGRPDLTVLDEDFVIIDRRQESSISVIDGQRQTRYRLSLRLLPRQTGEIEIPPIPVGASVTRPLRLRVTEAVDPRAPTAADPWVGPPVPPRPVPALPGSGWLGPPPVEPIPRWPDRDGSSVAGAESPTGDGGRLPGAWIWYSALLALAWAVTLFLWWRGRRPPVAPAAMVADLRPSAPADPWSKAIDAVRIAYQAGDAPAAREALLAWSRLRWPHDPPGNIARLVLRCQEPLKGQIALLEKALYSPEPLSWNRELVWETLAAEQRVG